MKVKFFILDQPFFHRLAHKLEQKVNQAELLENFEFVFFARIEELISEAEKLNLSEFQLFLFVSLDELLNKDLLERSKSIFTGVIGIYQNHNHFDRLLTDYMFFLENAQLPDESIFNLVNWLQLRLKINFYKNFDSQMQTVLKQVRQDFSLLHQLSDVLVKPNKIFPKNISTFFKYFAGTKDSFDYFDQIVFKKKQEVIILLASFRNYGENAQLINQIEKIKKENVDLNLAFNTLKEFLLNSVASFCLVVFKQSQNLMEILASEDMSAHRITKNLYQNFSNSDETRKNFTFKKMASDGRNYIQLEESIAEKTTFVFGVGLAAEILDKVDFKLIKKDLAFPFFCHEVIFQFYETRSLKTQKDATLFFLEMNPLRLRLV